MEEASAKPSGIPRASRLPVLNKRPSQPSLSKTEDTSSAPSGSGQRPQLRKPSSVASFTKSTSSNTVSKAPSGVSKPSAGATSSSTGLKQPSKTSTAPRIAPRPLSRGNQQRRAPSPRKPVATTEDEENNDQLSSLDSFRSASRQGFHDESPTDPPDDLEFPGVPSNAKDRKGSRPSLSDRTIESLQHVPTTPKDRRRSSFFSPVESPMGPPPRPASSLSRNGSDRSSRPGTSDGSFMSAVGRATSNGRPTSSSAKPATRTSLGGFGFTPRTNSRLPSASKPFAAQDDIPPVPRSPSPSKRAAMSATRANGAATGRMTGSKTVGGRPSKPRPALSDAFGPAVTAGSERDQAADTKPVRQNKAPSPSASKQTASNPPNSSSAALRQQIAAAKAAKKKEKSKMDAPQSSFGSAAGDSFEMDMHADPFNQAPRDEKHILRNRINTARMDGKLNIAALGLKEIPEAVMKMFDPAAMEEAKVSWAEMVDLSRLNAADNDIAEIDDSIFPDKTMEDYADDEDSVGNQFGGLENLDLHGNKLQALPIGLRRLERLTVLNLSHNKLENDALDVVSQIPSLRDLRLGHNALSGSLPSSICDLQSLENLDLQSNRLLALPEAIRELTILRMLNVSGNQLTALPMEALQDLRLTELDASSNALIGPLFPSGTSSAHTTLQTLKVSNNSLAAITFAETLELPALRTIDISSNHLTALPSIAGWTELITLMAGENKITDLPDGLPALKKLRNVNFASNGIRLLDPQIGSMESLEGLVMAGNPLRDKKFLTMNAGDIKRDLRARLEPADAEEDDEGPSDGGDSTGGAAAPSTTASATHSGWTLKPNHTLDLSGRNITDAVNDTLGAFLQAHEVKTLNLSSNKLSSIPPALWLGQDLRTLDLSGNALGSDYLSDELELPNLQELKMAGCILTTLAPLLTSLIAPKLQTLNLTANRLTGPVPSLRTAYPALTTFLAGDNKFTSVSASSLQGLHTVNLQSNALEALPAEIGLLWGEGLRSLEVGMNAFRVPNFRVLDKGTEATLRWLRGRIEGYVEE